MNAPIDDPDPWDECGACGHDREEHDRVGCLARTASGLCDCIGFTEDGR